MKKFIIPCLAALALVSLSACTTVKEKAAIHSTPAPTEVVQSSVSATTLAN